MTLGLGDLAARANAGQQSGPITNARVRALAEVAQQQGGDRSGAAPIALDGFTPVYSRSSDRLFLVGGQPAVAPNQITNGAGQLTTNANQLWVGAPGESLVPVALNVQLGRVLSATYHQDAGLVVLDDVDGRGRFARLLVIEPESGESTTLATWPRIGVFDTWHVVANRGAGILIAASSSRLRQHIVASLDLDSGRIGEVVRGNGQLALAPVVDERGYQRIVLEPRTGEMRAFQSLALDPGAQPGQTPVGIESPRGFLGRWRKWSSLFGADLLRPCF